MDFGQSFEENKEETLSDKSSALAGSSLSVSPRSKARLRNASQNLKDNESANINNGSIFDDECSKSKGALPNNAANESCINNALSKISDSVTLTSELDTSYITSKIPDVSITLPQILAKEFPKIQIKSFQTLLPEKNSVSDIDSDLKSESKDTALQLDMALHAVKSSSHDLSVTNIDNDSYSHLPNTLRMNSNITKNSEQEENKSIIIESDAEYEVIPDANSTSCIVAEDASKRKQNPDISVVDLQLEDALYEEFKSEAEDSSKNKEFENFKVISLNEAKDPTNSDSKLENDVSLEEAIIGVHKAKVHKSNKNDSFETVSKYDSSKAVPDFEIAKPHSDPCSSTTQPIENWSKLNNSNFKNLSKHPLKKREALKEALKKAENYIDNFSQHGVIAQPYHPAFYAGNQSYQNYYNQYYLQIAPDLNQYYSQTTQNPYYNYYSSPYQSLAFNPCSSTLPDPYMNTCSAGVRVLKSVVTEEDTVKLDTLNSSSLSQSTYLFNSVFVIGQRYSLFPITEFNLDNIQVIYQDLSYVTEETVPTILTKLPSTQVTHNAVCLFAFDVYSFLKFKNNSPSCKKYNCPSPLPLFELRPHENSPHTPESCIKARIREIGKFVDKISEHIPSIILPLYPSKVYCDNDAQLSKHLSSHSISNERELVVFGKKDEWVSHFQSIMRAWSETIIRNHAKYTSLMHVAKYFAEQKVSLMVKDGLFAMLEKDTKPDLWRSFVKTLSEVFFAGTKELPATLKSEHKVKEPKAISIQEFLQTIPDMEIEKKSHEELPKEFYSDMKADNPSISSYLHRQSYIGSSKSEFGNLRQNSMLTSPDNSLTNVLDSHLGHLTCSSASRAHRRSQSQSRSCRRSRSRSRSKSYSRSVKKSCSRSCWTPSKSSKSGSRSHRSQSKSYRSTISRRHSRSSKRSRSRSQCKITSQHASSVSKTMSKSHMKSRSHLPKKLQKNEDDFSTYTSHSLKEVLGSVFEDFMKAEEDLKASHEEQYSVFEDLPEMHPEYETHYEKFASDYANRYGIIGEAHKEDQWNAYWKSCYRRIKLENWVKKRTELLGKFISKANRDNGGTFSRVMESKNVSEGMPSMAEFSIEGTLALLEKLTEYQGVFGNALLTLVKSARNIGPDTPKGLQLFVDRDNVFLISRIIDKLKSSQKTASIHNIPTLLRAEKWAAKLLEYAKNPPEHVKRVADIDLNVIAKASYGKDCSVTLDLINAALTYEGITLTNTEINEIYVKVCNIHFNMQLKDSAK